MTHHAIIDFPMPPRLTLGHLRVDAGAVATQRSLRVAIERAFERQAVQKRHFAIAHGMSATQLSRGLDASRGDGLHLRRLAAAVGYEPHPHMADHYRRAGTVDAPEVADEDDGLDPESRAELAFARWERMDHDASHCVDDPDEDPETPEEREQRLEAGHDVFVAAWEDEQEAVWGQYVAMMTPCERGEVEYPVDGEVV